MIKQAIEYVVGLGKVERMEIKEREYTTERLYPVLEPKAEMLEVTTLGAIVDYIESKIDGVKTKPELIHIESPTSVRLYSPVYGEFQQRECYMQANPLIPDINFGCFQSGESFIISMQSKFVKNEDSEIILKVAGNLKSEAVQTVGDDGVSQAVTVKTGVAQLDNVLVPNPVRLAPYRTFPEIEQPESDFIFRMKEGPNMALFEADGGAWRIEAMQRTKEYLEEKLKEYPHVKIIS